MDQKDTTSQRAGARWLAGMGLALALMGMVFVGVLWKAWQRAEETRHWTPTPARIVSSQVKSEQPTTSSPTVYRVMIRYTYSFGGKDYTSERYRRVDGPKGNSEDAEALREQFTPGQQVTCYVRPEQPSFAILKHDTRAALYTIWFPLLFVVGGLRMAWAALRSRSAR